jgi:hypothetical protein
MDEVTKAIIETMSFAARKKIRGSLTFQCAVYQRDWEAVKHLAPLQKDAIHRRSVLDEQTRIYIRDEAYKDGYSLTI